LSRPDEKLISNIAKAASARPSPPVRETQLHVRQLILIGQAHVDAHLDVAVYCNGIGGEPKVCGGTAGGAEVDGNCQLRLVAAADSNGKLLHLVEICW
jgi:hypothetical protein